MTGWVSTVYQGELLGLWNPHEIVIYVENHPPPQTNLAVGLLSPHRRVAGINQRTIYSMYIGVMNSGRHDSPYIRKLSLDHDSGGEKRGCQPVFSEIFHVTHLYLCNPHVSSLTASLAIIIPTPLTIFRDSQISKIREHDTARVLSRPL